MKSRLLIYTAVCLVALLYLALANARGFVPFAANDTFAKRSGGSTTAGRFHK